jgi:dihydrofolate reductase
MGKVCWHCTMSLDGFVAGPGHSMAWMQDLDVRPGVVADYIATTGAILGGRRGWDAVVDDVRPYGGAWKGPIFVLTHHPEDARPADDVTFLDCDLADALSICLRAAKGKNVEIFSADISGQAIQRGLLDEIAVHVAPVLLGDGVRFYEAAGGEPVRWRRVDANTEFEVVDLRYEPIRATAASS